MPHQEYINTFTDETIIYNNTYHTYYSTDGKRLLGASSYAKQFGEPFPKEQIISNLSKKWNMPPQEIDQMWSLNGDISNSYGTAVHAAMELWFRFHQKGKEIQDQKQLDHNYVLPKNAHLRSIVSGFVDTYGDLDIIPEATLSAVSKGMAGRTDGIHLTGKKQCRVIDFKTNNEMTDDKLLKYNHQLSFYADILTYHGWEVEGLDIYYHDGSGWNHIEQPVLPVTISEQPEGNLSTVGRRPPVYKGV